MIILYYGEGYFVNFLKIIKLFLDWNLSPLRKYPLDFVINKSIWSIFLFSIPLQIMNFLKKALNNVSSEIKVLQQKGKEVI